MDHHSNHSNGRHKSRPMLQANFSVGTTEKSNGASQAPMIPSGGVTAALGVSKHAASQGKQHLTRTRSNAHYHQPGTHQAWAPHLAGLPPDAQQTAVHRLAGMPAGNGKQPESQAQFKQQLGSRASLREPVSKDPLRTNAPRPADPAYR